AKGDYGKALNLLEDQRHTLGEKTFNRIKTEFQQQHRQNVMTGVLSKSKTGELIVGPKFTENWAKVRQEMANAGMDPADIQAIDQFAETIGQHQFSEDVARQGGMATRGSGYEKARTIGATAAVVSGHPGVAASLAAYPLIPRAILKTLLRQAEPGAVPAMTAPKMGALPAIQQPAGPPPPPSGVRIRPRWPPRSR